MYKHLHLILTALLLCAAGLLHAQDDIYTAGFYYNNGVYDGQEVAAVYKNGVELYNYVSPLSYMNSRVTSIAIDPDTKDVYWARCYYRNTSMTGTYYADVFKNSTLYLSLTDLGTWVEQLCFSDGHLYALGKIENDHDQIKTVCWKDNNTTPYIDLNDYHANSYLVTTSCGCMYVNNGDVYIGTSAGKVTKNGEELYYHYDYEICGIAFYDNHLYYAGNTYQASKVWKDGDLLYDFSGMVRDFCMDGDDNYTLLDPGAGYKVFKNGNVIIDDDWYDPDCMAVNSHGVYTTGNGRVFKNHEILFHIYSPWNHDFDIVALQVDAHCGDDGIRGLPFTDGFETSETDWECWTKIDVDNANSGYPSYWDRSGAQSAVTPYSGDHCAKHRYLSSASQTGWLISPRLFLQPGRDLTQLKFKTYEQYPNDYNFEGVFVSTTGTSPSDFTQVWTQNNPSDSWKTVTVDLSAYQGEAVYIGFKYSGQNAHNWYIDNVEVTESGSQCYTQGGLPYTQTFDYELGSCWYIIDTDMSGGHKCWKWNSSEQCAYHPWGQQNMPQEGWLFSRPISIWQEDYGYKLSFRSKSTSSGTGKRNSVWIAVDQPQSQEPDPSDYTEIWVDPAYNSSWTDYEIDLSDYAGHNINIAFKYEGTYAHNWFIDDFTITETLRQYNINVEANNASYGTVSGGGTFDMGATCTITATAYSGYEFKKWTKDGADVSTSESYSFTVFENATYVAVFGEPAITYYTVSTAANPTEGGTVTGGGTYASGTEVTLTAIPNEGYEFVKWNDNNTNNPRTITVNGDVTYTGQFAHTVHTLTVTASPSDGGTVTGSGTYNYGQTVTLNATPAAGYEFLNWSDGSTEPHHLVVVSGDADYVGYFAAEGVNTYTITAVPNDPSLGEVTGSGTYAEGSLVTLRATPLGYASFVRWNDGNTHATRHVTVTANATYTAIFETNTLYTITVVSENPSMGSVSGGGNYPMGAEVTIQANPLGGFYFDGWNDNNYNNPRTVTVTGNATYTARFSAQQTVTYTLTATCNPMHGYVTGSGNYLGGANVTVKAVPYEGYEFEHWNDNVTQNPRLVTVSNNMTLVAFFRFTDVDENAETVMSLYPNPTKESIRLKGIEDNSEVVIYNTLGMMVKTVNAEQEISVSDLAAGVYTVRCGNQVLRFVKM